MILRIFFQSPAYMDVTQLVIVFVSITLTVLLVIVGIQIFFILSEIRITVQKFNKMLDDMGKVSGVASDSIVNMSGMLSGLKAGLSFLTSFRKKVSDE